MYGGIEMDFNKKKYREKPQLIRARKIALKIKSHLIGQQDLPIDKHLKELEELISEISFSREDNIGFVISLISFLIENESPLAATFGINITKILYCKLLRGEKISIYELLTILLILDTKTKASADKAKNAEIKKLISEIYFYQEDLTSAIHYAKLALIEFENTHNKPEVATLTMLLADLFNKKKELLAAIGLYQKASDIFAELGLAQASFIALKRKNKIENAIASTQALDHEANHWKKDHCLPNVYHLQKLK